jgi:hypothetical protein
VFGCIDDDDHDDDDNESRTEKVGLTEKVFPSRGALGPVEERRSIRSAGEQEEEEEECLVLDRPESGNRTRWGFWVSGYSRHLVV